MPTLEKEFYDAGSVEVPAAKHERKFGQGIKAFDFTCRHYLKISGKEFLDLYKAGKFNGSTETGVQRVVAMLPFAF